MKLAKIFFLVMVAVLVLFTSAYASEKLRPSGGINSVAGVSGELERLILQLVDSGAVKKGYIEKAWIKIEIRVKAKVKSTTGKIYSDNILNQVLNKLDSII